MTRRQRNAVWVTIALLLVAGMVATGVWFFRAIAELETDPDADAGLVLRIEDFAAQGVVRDCDRLCERYAALPAGLLKTFEYEYDSGHAPEGTAAPFFLRSASYLSLTRFGAWEQFQTQRLGLHAGMSIAGEGKVRLVEQPALALGDQAYVADMMNDEVLVGRVLIVRDDNRLHVLLLSGTVVPEISVLTQKVASVLARLQEAGQSD